MSSYEPMVSRRVTMGWLLASIGVAQLPRQAFAAASPTQGYGFDPQLDRYEAPWPRLLSKTQLRQLAVLVDIILPGDAQSPAPSAVGIPDFLDEWISAPYPTQLRDRTIIVDGLAWLDQEAIRKGTTGWLAASADLQDAMITGIAGHGSPPGIEHTVHFFRRVRSLVVGAYYTTDKGMAALGYVGNVALESYPQVSGALHLELEVRMQKLGLL